MRTLIKNSRLFACFFKRLEKLRMDFCHFLFWDRTFRQQGLAAFLPYCHPSAEQKTEEINWLAIFKADKIRGRRGRLYFNLLLICSLSKKHAKAHTHTHTLTHTHTRTSHTFTHTRAHTHSHSHIDTHVHIHKTLSCKNVIVGVCFFTELSAFA